MMSMDIYIFYTLELMNDAWQVGTGRLRFRANDKAGRRLRIDSFLDIWLDLFVLI